MYTAQQWCNWIVWKFYCQTVHCFACFCRSKFFRSSIKFKYFRFIRTESDVVWSQKQQFCGSTDNSWELWFWIRLLRCRKDYFVQRFYLLFAVKNIIGEWLTFSLLIPFKYDYIIFRFYWFSSIFPLDFNINLEFYIENPTDNCIVLYDFLSEVNNIATTCWYFDCSIDFAAK